MARTNTRLLTSRLFITPPEFLFQKRTDILVFQNPVFMKSLKLLIVLSTLSCLSLFSSCSKENNPVSVTSDLLVRSKWSVDYYFSNENLTANYEGYQLLFSTSGLLVAKHENNMITGEWSSAPDLNSNEVLTIHLDTTDPDLLKLNQQWKVSAKTSVLIQLETPVTGSAPVIFNIRKS
jgi:hypothetical protein